MSHHLDSPIARQDVRLDITDFYCFRGEQGTVFALNVCHSIAGDVPTPGFHPEGMYEFKIDLDHNAVEELTYRVIFGERNNAGNQHYEIRRIEGAEATDPHARGVTVAQGVMGETTLGENGLRAWAGKAGDPFWIEPDVLHAVGHVFQDGTALDLGTWSPAEAKNLFAGHTVYSLVLEVADDDLLARAGGNRDIGVWALASLATDAGGWRSINRAGLPMIHPLFTQFNEALGDSLNAGRPADDFATHGETFIRSIAGAIKANGTAIDPVGYATRVAHRFLPNILPYTVGTEAVFGMASWNGRSLIDNAPDVMFTIAANSPIALEIGRESVTSKPTSTFPYMPPLA
ncbi:DUF4331 family protein [Paraburkholderia pallida]|uniref:DUF4331 domain-containing protein n=1 Tax=Paraburkholderia pallida TaxID=2547399 RepID=A0A4P7D6G0_9BURK|nr:DUF4331 family protein [Paraburkholderia pallida]QBR03728.1 DUF4331 domain-containing protein [Paraburkholderia pallida]